jgi:hypothetical protein
VFASTGFAHLKSRDPRASVVRRNGVKLGLLILLPLLALAGCATATTPAGSSTVVHGLVLAAPGCPVERADSPCPAFHVAGATVVASVGGTEIARVVSALDGSFTLTLSTGTYTLSATAPGGYRSSASQVVRLDAPGTQDVTITLDSGIR